MRASLRVIIGDVVQDELLLNRATPRTIASLLFRPGHLTDEYLRGRMASYIPPLRLYLVASVVFFLMVSFVGLRALDRAPAIQFDGAADADSARAALLVQRAELEAVDTVTMPEVGRAVLRMSLDNNARALAALDDTTGAIPAGTVAELVRRARGDTPVMTTGMQPWAEQIRVQAGSDWLQGVVDRKLAQVGHLSQREAIRTILSDMLDYAPHLVFVLLPVFALLLKLLYVRRRRYYAEHFTFALHVHAFFFVMFTIMFLLPWDNVNGPLILWMAAYVWLAMKRVYGQGWFRTTAKWWVLGWSYVIVLVLGLAGLTVTALLT
ncbi:MAG TPA: DUF3667 domain-containing protein [Longimicrobiales bacterium]|nr:DUF3667 domain-containing protein [Longimicrobiales bacterium]